MIYNIYCTSVPHENLRKRILEKCCQHMEIGNSFWELEDDCTQKDGVGIDILYRNIEFFPKQSILSLRHPLHITVT